MELMAQFEDNYFDLAIVDPPYGLGNKLAHAGNGKNAQSKFSQDFYSKNWDNKTPDKKYFDELFRVSKNQIIWGGNYFDLPPTRCFIIWDKMVYIPTMSQIEQAWTSFDKLPILKKINNNDADRIHLTQKPVKLYNFLLSKFATPEMKILDTHLGSGSIAIAAHYFGCDLIGCEIDTEYYNKMMKRIRNETAQTCIEFNH